MSPVPTSDPIRDDRVGKDGKVTLRHAGVMHHIGIGIDHKHTRVVMIIDTVEVTVVNLFTGEIIAMNQIDPTRNYWRNQMRAAGRWPSTA